MSQGLAATEFFFHGTILGFAAPAAGVVFQPARPAAPSKAPASSAVPSKAAAVPAAKALARPKTEEDRIELELLGGSSPYIIMLW